MKGSGEGDDSTGVSAMASTRFVLKVWGWM